VTPNLGFKVTGYLKVEYLADGARVFNCTKHSSTSLGALAKTCKKIGVVAENFLLKALEGVLHHLRITASVFVETSTHTYSLSEEGFGIWLQLWTVKKLNEPCACLVKYLAKMWNNSKNAVAICCDASQMDGRTELI